MSQPTTAALMQHDKSLENMLHVFSSACRRDGYHPPDSVIEELRYKIANGHLTHKKITLELKSYSIDDQLLSYILDALAVYPAVAELDLSENSISDVGAKYLLKLLKAQANLVKNVNIDKRLHATFIGSVDMSDNYSQISPHLSDEILLVCEALSYANTQASVRRAFLINGMKHFTNERRMGKAWDNVIWEHFPQLQPYVVTSTDRKSHYAQGTHDFSTTRSTSPSGRSVASGHTLSTSMSMISSSGSKVPSSVAETSVMRALQTSGRAPYLTKWQYSLIGVSEVRGDESICDKSVLSSSTVFDQMDSLSISASRLGLSPLSKSKLDSNNGNNVGAEIATNAELLYQIIDPKKKGFFTEQELERALSSSSEVLEAFMFYMNGDIMTTDKDDISTLDGGSVFSFPDESKHLVRLMDTKNTGRVEKSDFLNFIMKSASAVARITLKDLSTSKQSAQSSQTHSVTFSDVDVYGIDQASHADRSRNTAVNTATLVQELMEAFLQRLKSTGGKAVDGFNAFSYDKSKEERAISVKQEKASNFCKEYFDGSGVSMESLMIPRILDYSDYSKLRFLALRDCSIKYVDASAIDQLNKLKALDLSHNLIDDIDGGFFPKSLRTLNLSYNLLEHTSFSHLCQRVTELNLAGNQIRNIDILPEKLAKFNIADNKISDVLDLRVIALHSITSLTLAGNPVINSSRYLKATISSLFPLLEELDGVMLPRRVNSRMIRKSSSSMTMQILGESRGRTSMTKTYQQQVDKKRSDEFKLREELRREKLREYVQSFTKTMSRKAVSPEKIENISLRLYNGKHNSMAHQRGYSRRGGSADSARTNDDEIMTSRRKLSLSPKRIEEVTNRLYAGSHHRVHMGPPPEHPSSPRKYKSSAPKPGVVPIQPFSPRESDRGTTMPRERMSKQKDAPIRLKMPIRNTAQAGASEIERENSNVNTIDDDSFMTRPPSFKKPPMSSPKKQLETASPAELTDRIKRLLVTFIAVTQTITSVHVSKYVTEKLHEIAGGIDSYLAPFLTQLFEQSIDGVLGIEESPGNLAFHKFSDGEKDVFTARWLASQTAACIRAAESEKFMASDAESDVVTGDLASQDFPYAECVQMATAMSPFMKENPVNWMFCASILRRVESKRRRGEKLATFVYEARSDLSEQAEEKTLNPDNSGSDFVSYKSAEQNAEKLKIAVDAETLNSVSQDQANPFSQDIDDVKKHLHHASPIEHKYESNFPTPPDNRTLTTREGIRVFDRKEKVEPVITGRPNENPLVTPRDMINSSTSFLDVGNETLCTPPILPRRRSKSNTSLAGEDHSPHALEEANRRRGSRSNAMTPSEDGGPLTTYRATSAREDGSTLRNHIGQTVSQDSQDNRPSSRNSVHSNATDDVAAGDVFSRMNNLKSRISNSSRVGESSRTADDDVKSFASGPTDDDATSQRHVPSVQNGASSAIELQQEAQKIVVPTATTHSSSPERKTASSKVSSPDSNKEMSAVDRLKARLARKGSDQSLSSFEGGTSVDSALVLTESKDHAIDPPAAHSASAVLSKNAPPNEDKNIQLSGSKLAGNSSLEDEAPVSSLAGIVKSNGKPSRKQLTVDASAPLAVSPAPATPTIVPTPKRAADVGSFSAAIANALPSPASRSSFTGASPPQKLLQSVIPASPGARMPYRASPTTPGTYGATGAAVKKFDFLDTVLNSVDQDDESSAGDISNGPLKNVKSLTETRRSILSTSPSEQNGALGPSIPSPVPNMSLSPGSLDDKYERTSTDAPVPSSTFVPGGIASMPKKYNDLKRSQTDVAAGSKNDDTSTELIKKSLSEPLQAEDVNSVSSGGEVGGAITGSNPAPPLSKKNNSFAKSVKSMLGFKKKDK